jgi:hypothetical protein
MLVQRHAMFFDPTYAVREKSYRGSEFCLDKLAPIGFEQRDDAIVVSPEYLVFTGPSPPLLA